MHKNDVEKNTFLEFFPLNLETNPNVLTDESNPDDSLPQGKILTLLLLEIMKLSTSKTFISYEILTLNTHDTKMELKHIIKLLQFTDHLRVDLLSVFLIFCNKF